MKKAKRPPRRKWWEVAPGSAPPEWLEVETQKEPRRFIDPSFKLPVQHSDWFTAFDDVDRASDQRAFVTLIRPHVPEPVLPYFDDFFERNEIRTRRQKGRPAKPMYRQTDRDEWIAIGIERVWAILNAQRARKGDAINTHARAGVATDEAIDAAVEEARKLGIVTIPFKTLKNEFKGKGKKRRQTDDPSGL